VGILQKNARKRMWVKLLSEIGLPVQMGDEGHEPAHGRARRMHPSRKRDFVTFVQMGNGTGLVRMGRFGYEITNL
jgi:hypothetical protein